MRSSPFVQVDAFTTEPFGGNPAAVFLLDKPAEASWMQSVALEMHLSESAFLVHRSANEYDLRWFTPAVEVDLCGHATLAAAHVLRTADETEHDSYVFHTRSGRLEAEVADDGLITLDFPADKPIETSAPTGIDEALGTKPVAVARGVSDYLVEVDSAETVRGLDPNQTLLADIDVPRGFIVTAAHDSPDFDIISRWFGPRAGVYEDPVTGSAHTTLAPWWSERLQKTALRAEQASPRRGEVMVRLLPGDRVALSGHGVTVARGEVFV